MLFLIFEWRCFFCFLLLFTILCQLNNVFGYDCAPRGFLENAALKLNYTTLSLDMNKEDININWFIRWLTTKGVVKKKLGDADKDDKIYPFFDKEFTVTEIHPFHAVWNVETNFLDVFYFSIPSIYFHSAKLNQSVIWKEPNEPTHWQKWSNTSQLSLAARVRQDLRLAPNRRYFYRSECRFFTNVGIKPWSLDTRDFNEMDRYYFCGLQCTANSGQTCLYDQFVDIIFTVNEEPQDSEWDDPSFSFACNIIQQKKPVGPDFAKSAIRVWHKNYIANESHVELKEEDAECYEVDGLSFQMFNENWIFNFSDCMPFNIPKYFAPLKPKPNWKAIAKSEINHPPWIIGGMSFFTFVISIILFYFIFYCVRFFNRSRKLVPDVLKPLGPLNELKVSNYGSLTILSRL